jgi:hypothetical protein
MSATAGTENHHLQVIDQFNPTLFQTTLSPHEMQAAKKKIEKQMISAQNMSQ